MGRKIEDEFSHLPRQVAYQKRHHRDGLCKKCSRKIKKFGLCRKHFSSYEADYERRRKREKMKRRYRPRKKPFGKVLPTAV
jgi:ribosomal protein S14